MLEVGSRQVVGCATRRAHKRRANKLGAVNRRPSTIENPMTQSHPTRGGGRRRLCDQEMSRAEPSSTVAEKDTGNGEAGLVKSQGYSGRRRRTLAGLTN
jgi:hypothetical protein